MQPATKRYVYLLMKNLFLFAISVIALVSGASAQKVYEPKKGSAERTTIMNSIRAYDVKRDSKLAAEKFQVTALRVQSGWAYANVESSLPAGGDTYGQAHVFLRKSAGKWKVVFSTYNDANEVGVVGLDRLRKRNRAFPRGLADFAMQYLAG